MSVTGRWPAVRPGDRGDRVRAVQHLLLDAGYTLGVDGIFGPTTEDRVRRYQRKHRLTVDGVVGTATWPPLALRIASGSKQHAVRAAQTLLLSRGYPVRVDGDFGPETVAATRAFEADRGLAVDGIVATDTWYALVSGFAVLFDTHEEASRNLLDAWRAGDRRRAVSNAPNADVALLFTVPAAEADPQAAGCVPAGDGFDCAFRSPTGDVVVHVVAQGRAGFHTSSVVRRERPGPTVALRVLGPLWEAEAQLVELADPRRARALRALFADAVPHRTPGGDAQLRPGVLLALCAVHRVTVRSGPAARHVWSRPSGAPTDPAASPQQIRAALAAGRLALLLVTAAPEAWGNPEELVVTCVGGDIALDVLTPEPGTATALYSSLGLQPPPPGAATGRSGPAGLLGAMSVHASGLSLLGAATLPWDDDAVHGVFQVAPTWAGPAGRPVGLRMTVEQDRLTAAEGAALLASWQRLSRYVNPRHPLSRLFDPPAAPTWATLELTDPLGVPGLFWEPTAAGPGPLRIPSGAVAVLLADQQPYSVDTPPTTAARIDVEVVITRDGDGLHVAVGSGPMPGSDGPTLDYTAMPVAGRWRETATLRAAELAFDPVAVPRLLRAQTDDPEPRWQPPATPQDIPVPLVDPVVWAHVPLADGWATLPVPNLTEQIYLDAELAVSVDPRPSVLQGAVAVGNDQPAARATWPGEQPWRLTLVGATRVEGSWTLAPAGDGYALAAASLRVEEPDVVAEGLLWVGLEAPSAADALPTLDDWVAGAVGVPLRTLAAASFPPVIRLAVDVLTIERRDDATGSASADLGAWSLDCRADAVLLGRLVTAGVLPPDVFTAHPPLVWRRHPTVPTIQALPLTQTLSPPHHPSASRQLAPFELPTANGLPEGWVLGSTGAGAAEWPRMLGAAVPAREWASLADLPLAVLSLPGLLLTPVADDTTPLADPGSGLAAGYRHDLPYTDEPNALAQTPPDPGTDGAARPIPPPPLTRAGFAGLWRALAARAAVAAADATDLFDGDTARVVEPRSWPVHHDLDLTAYPGVLTLDNAAPATTAPLVLAGADALRGIEGTFVDEGDHIVRRPDSDGPADTDYVVTATSLATRCTANGAFGDQRGLHREATTIAGPLLRTPVTLDGVRHELATLLAPVPLTAGGTTWQFWFRDLPVTDGTAFRRERSERVEDVNDPEARSRDHVHLQGYEWRIAPAAGPTLVLFGLHLHPLTLESVDLDDHGVRHLELVGRLQLPVPDAAEQTDLANAVRLTFTAGGPDGLVLDAVDVVGTGVDWPLRLVDGEVGRGPRLRWSAVVRAGDRLEIRDARLHVDLLGVAWRVALPVLPFTHVDGRLECTVALTPPGPAPALAPGSLRLVLDPATGVHEAGMTLALDLGDAPATFTAEVAFDLFGPPGVARWTTGRLFGLPIDVPSGDGAPPVSVDATSLQLTWAGLDVPDPAAVHLLPGAALAGSAAPGFVALAFTATPADDGTARFTLRSGFVESVLTCHWGHYLQDRAAPDAAAVFGSSAGDLTVGHTSRWDGAGWATALLVDGLLEVTNLFSAPLRATLDGLRLTLPAAGAAGTAFDHVRHTVRILLNQHPLPAELLAAASGAALFTLAPGRSWEPVAVVEHQLLRIDMAADGDPAPAGELRWAGVQEVRILGPATFRASLIALGDAETPAGTGESVGHLGAALRARLAAADGELAGLPADMLLVEAGSTHFLGLHPPLDPLLTQDAARGAAATALAHLPGGTSLAELSRPADFAPTDPADPGWHPLTVPFLGRLQERSSDGVEPATGPVNPLQVDPVLVLSRDRSAGRPPTGLATALATWAGDTPTTVTVSAADLPAVRATPRLDPLALEESWFRLHGPSPEPATTGLAGVTATLSDTPARLSRPTALRQALDPRRPSHPPTAMPEHPAAPPGADLLLDAVVTEPQSVPGWTSVTVQLAGGLLPADGARQDRVAAALLPARPAPDGPAGVATQSLAVAPYLRLGWRPAPSQPESLEPRVLVAELLCRDAEHRLRPVAAHVWETGTDLPDLADARTLSVRWAIATRARLAPESPVAVLRYRQLDDNTNPDSPDEAALTTSYGFALVPIGPTALVAGPVAPLRADPRELRFREGQRGPATMPDDIRAADLAPPQITGVQPVHLVDVPGWRWGLSALRVGVRYAADERGRVGSAGTPDDGRGATVWWQMIQHPVQFRSGLHDGRPTGGLPALFRAPAIAALLPVLPEPRLPELDPALFAAPKQTGTAVPPALHAWQPVLPGSLRFLVTGSRPGVPVAIRVQLARHSGIGAAPAVLVSGSVPAQHRVPRPVPLPPNDGDRPEAALVPWAGWFDPTDDHRATPGPADEAFRAALGGQPARRLRLTLTDPPAATVTATTAARLVLDAELDGPGVAGGWDVVGVALVDGDTAFPYTGPDVVDATGAVEFVVSDADALAARLETRPSGSPLELRLQVIPHGVTDGYAHELTFPLRIGGRPAGPPLEPRFVHFEDPEYNRRLSSPAARAGSVITLPGPGGTLTQRPVTLAAERHECNPTGALVVRYDWAEEPEAGSVEHVGLSVQRLDHDRIPRPVTISGPRDPLPPGVLQRIDLPATRLADGRAVPWKAGDVLQLTLEIRAAGVGAAVQRVVLAVAVVADPVVPVSIAAYGLLRVDDGPHGREVQCVRFAWKPAPARVELVAPDDLRLGIVRRRAVFHLTDTVRRGGSPRYGVQKITTTGATNMVTWP